MFMFQNKLEIDHFNTSKTITQTVKERKIRINYQIWLSNLHRIKNICYRMKIKAKG